MPEARPNRKRVLVAEDEYMLADDLRRELEDLGHITVGPVGNLEDLLALIASGQPFDAAILDVNLGGELVYPAADSLLEKNKPFVLATGYEASSVPERFRDIACLEKPLRLSAALAALHLA